MPGDQRRPTQPKARQVSLDARETLESLRPSSLPPELGELDFNWDDDVADPRPRATQPTISRLELDLELDEGDRPTAVPSIPMDQFVARAMAAVDREEQSQLTSQPPQSLRVMTLRGLPATSVGTDSFEERSSFPPTLPSNRAATSSTGTTGTKPMDPLAVDFSEMDVAPPGSYLTATEPPQDISDQHPANIRVEATRAPEPAPVRDAAATLPPGEDNYRPTMKDRYAMGDFTGALEIAETLLAQDSADLEAQRYATSCRDVLTQMYLSRLGGLDQVISVILRPEELRWLTLDHRAGFLLSLVDGASTIEELLDISGMPRLDALKILATLREQRAILLGSR
jgi:hypothetical protein